MKEEGSEMLKRNFIFEVLLATKIFTALKMILARGKRRQCGRKIREEKKYHNQKSCIEIYKREVKDRIKLIIFDAYYEKGYTTARAMAKYFDIPVTSAHYYIRDIKHDLNKIKDENKSRIQG